GYWTPSSSASAQANNSAYFWHRYSCNVPAAASTTSTKFRWAQLATSNTGFDAWGIDEVQISCPNNQNVIWSHGPTVLNPTSPVYPTTTTDYIVAIFDSMSNFAFDTVRITVLPVPNPDLGPDTFICDNGTNHAIFDAGAGYNSYHWNTNATTQTITPNISGFYSVTVTNGNCSGVDSVYLTMTSTPVADAGSDVSICYGENTTLTALSQPSATYLWSSGETTNIINVNPTTTTTYVVTVSLGNNCYSSDTVVVTVNPLPVANAGADAEICFGDSVQLVASGGINYLWNTGANSANILEYPTVTSDYYVTVTDANGCQSSDQVEVVVNNLPSVVIFTDDDGICLGDNTMLNAHGADSYLWNTGETSASIIVEPIESTTFSVIGTSINGCIGHNDKFIRVEDCSTFFVPNSFTPDNNGENDYFKPYGDFDGIKSFRMDIYNKWGEKIYTSKDIYGDGWDGEYNNQKVPEGVYTYFMTFINAWDKEFSKTGTVTLIR
ncbi:MAG: gliding motility-associated C-terminal domain-containing protein, partial [Saprospiraceae bacterium]|nr:gliding motility-associated C-terminal domain-containing protein [Saprospiraceae bacterium]